MEQTDFDFVMCSTCISFYQLARQPLHAMADGRVCRGIAHVTRGAVVCPELPPTLKRSLIVGLARLRSTHVNLGYVQINRKPAGASPQYPYRPRSRGTDRTGQDIQLLEHIHATGSISAAGRAMAMSYKRAWDLVDELNRICGQPAVERQTGGDNGAELSSAIRPAAHQALSWHRKRCGHRRAQGAAGAERRIGKKRRF